MFWLAFKTLIHEKGRLFITLIGIVFSTVLALIEISIYLGMMGNATAVIRHTDADLWITSRNIQNFDFANPFPEHRINQVRALPEVERADKILLLYGFMKLPSGGREQVQMIGYDPDTRVGGPWAMVEGAASDVKGGRYMILDKTSEQRLGKLETGTLWEVTFSKEESFRLVGLSEGIKSFTTIPLVFVSYNEARKILGGVGWEDQTFFITAKLKDPSQAAATAASLRKTMRDNDIYTRDEFVNKTVHYWTVQTGMGMAFFLTAILAVIIGGAIVGQTIYAGTMEHLREYGTLKALGAKNRDIYQVIFSQAGIGVGIGYSVGVLLVLLLRGGIEKAGVPFHLHPSVFAGLFVTILGTCLLASYLSVRKIRILDPVMVFKA